MNQKRIIQMQSRIVDDWNRQYREGQAVAVTKDDQLVVETTTRSEAFLLGGHTAVVMLDGIAGAYSLERVQAQ